MNHFNYLINQYLLRFCFVMSTRLTTLLPAQLVLSEVGVGVTVLAF